MDVPGTVLVVEDSDPVREIVSRVLRREGYEVVGAANGAEALAYMKRAVPDLVLLDVMMPEMDGIAMLAKLRQDPAYRDLPVILVTALSDEARMARARDLGVREYLVKSRFSYEELLDRVSRHVTRH
jgi:CheY-like chemotaxis protein